MTSKADETPLEPPLEVLVAQLEDVVNKGLTCPICLAILKDPRQCMNGHLFCSECIYRYIKENPYCPTCRCFLNSNPRLNFSLSAPMFH